MIKSRETATINSALWAVYGDTLGFPTELVDEAGLHRRVGERFVDRPLPWKRLVGGRTGTWVTLRAGAYSDDTQLRLATSRAIRADGYFDVEAFAKIELPVWLSYSLGAGRGSKVGAASLAQRSVNWFSNFFDQKDVVYVAGGGNGAAMRIQPHVWAAKDLTQSESYLEHVIQNSVCTHGHPRGIAGAAIHAALLAYVLHHGEIPSPNSWSEFGSYASTATTYIEKNPDLSTFWLPTWNSRTGKIFAEEMESARMEWERDISICNEIIRSNLNPADAYKTVLGKLGGLIPQQRGSALKCALFSLLAAWLFKEVGANEGIITVANILSSDTDTIGTMTGALLGALPDNLSPPHPVQDEQYIKDEAIRMFAISQQSCTESFTYPDLMTWQPPRSQLDVVGLYEDSIFVAGLGRVSDTGEKFLSNSEDSSWQWLHMPFGQSILCKQRIPLKELPSNNLPSSPTDLSTQKMENRIVPKPRLGNKKRTDENNDLFAEQRPLQVTGDIVHKSDLASNTYRPSISPRNLNELTDEIIRSGFDPKTIGITLMAMAEEDDGIEKAIAFSAIIVKARKARLRRNKE